MDRYQKILDLTKRIEKALQKEDLCENLTVLIKERVGLYKQLQTDEEKNTIEDAILIKQIQECEKRCVSLAQEKKQQIKKQITATQNNKRGHKAYSRQMASVY